MTESAALNEDGAPAIRAGIIGGSGARTSLCVDDQMEEGTVSKCRNQEGPDSSPIVPNT